MEVTEDLVEVVVELFTHYLRQVVEVEIHHLLVLLKGQMEVTHLEHLPMVQVVEVLLVLVQMITREEQELLPV